MSKTQELIIGLSFFLLSILIGGLYSSYVTEANSLAQVATKQTAVVSGANTEYPPIEINEKVRDFSLQDENSQIRSFQELRNNKPTLLYFFAGGCGHCLQMLPKLQENELLYRAKQLGYEVIGISFFGNPLQDKAIATKFGLPSPVLADPQGAVCKSFGVGEFSIALIGANNVFYYREMMYGNNWPNDELLKNTLKTSISTTRITPNDLQVNNIDQSLLENSKNTENSIFASLFTHDFTYTLLSKYSSLQKIYTFFNPILLLGIFLFTIVALTTTKNSWLPILAMSQVLLIATFYDNWLFVPANLFFILLLAYIWKKQDFFIPIIFVGSLIFLFFAMTSQDMPGFISQENLDQGLLRTLFFVIPSTLFSAIMVKMPLSTQSHSYTKFAYPIASNNMAAKNIVEGSIAIRTVSKAERCDICHKVDQFNLDTGYCLRCQTTTK